MASLFILKGANQGQRLSLEGERVVIGRSPDCHLTVPGTAISRQHAQILHLQGKYYIEDLASRNKTYVNNQELVPRQRVLLEDNDRIRICDFVCTFQESTPAETHELEPRAGPPDAEEPASSTILEASLTTTSSVVLQSLSAENLRLVLEVTNRLSKTLELDLLLPKIGECLFQLFKQVDRCLVILREEGTDKLVARVIKSRQAQDDISLRFSRSIVVRCLETAQAFLTNDASSDTRIPLSKSVVDYHLRSVMCVPLCTTEGQPYGVIQLDNMEASKKFTQDDLKLLVGVAHQASIALENAKLYEHLLAREQVERDLELAGQVQRSILPDQMPQLPGYDFFAYYAAALEVGGDYYDFIALPQQRLAIALGDVAGKGISAALLMAKLSSDARYCLQSEPDPALALARLNDLLYKNTSRTERFVTLSIAVLDPGQHTVTLVSAGHMLPLMYRRETGTLEEALPLYRTGLPLGVQKELTYSSHVVELGAGDCLLLFTDGVSDAVNVGNQSFQIQGIYAVLRGGGPYTPQSLGQRLLNAIEQHAAGRSQRDDITLVCFGRTGRPFTVSG